MVGAAVAAAVGCSRPDPCAGDGPAPLRPECVERASFRTCELQLRLLGREGLAQAFGLAPDAGPEEIARAFARPFTAFPEAAYEGCLDALR
jgi:hypothetical protein